MALQWSNFASDLNCICIYLEIYIAPLKKDQIADIYVGLLKTEHSSNSKLRKLTKILIALSSFRRFRKGAIQISWYDCIFNFTFYNAFTLEHQGAGARLWSQRQWDIQYRPIYIIIIGHIWVYMNWCYIVYSFGHLKRCCICIHIHVINRKISLEWLTLCLWLYSIYTLIKYIFLAAGQEALWWLLYVSYS